jgi:predicted HicB family RNase H-like nuclease
MEPNSGRTKRKQQQVHFRLSDRDHAALLRAAEDRGESVATMLRRLVRRFLDTSAERRSEL